MIHRTLKSLFTSMALWVALCAAPAHAADVWPSRPIRMIVPFAPGGSHDVIARKLSERLTALLGQSVVVENRGGAGSAGLGDSTQLATELLSNIAGIKMQAVGYNGIAPAQLDLLAGRLDLIITTIAAIRGTASEKLPKLAFTTAQRDPEFPDTPTAREAGLDYVVDVWWGVFAPRDLPPTILARMNGAIAQVAAEPAFAAFLKTSGAQSTPSSPEALQETLARDLARWTDTARRAGMRPN